MSWSYVVTAKAQRDIKKLDHNVRRRTGDAIKKLAVTWPNSANVIKFQGIDPPECRLRVGDWRVRFRADDDAKVIVVLRVLPRASAYRE